MIVVQIDDFLRRIELSRIDFAKQVGITPSLITHWAKGINFPSPKQVEKLIEMGITAEELFGRELGALILTNSKINSKFNDTEFQLGVKEALLQLLNK